VHPVCYGDWGSGIRDGGSQESRRQASCYANKNTRQTRIGGREGANEVVLIRFLTHKMSTNQGKGSFSKGKNKQTRTSD